MDASGASRLMHVLLTGPPGIGKTTICKKVVAMFCERAGKLDGFYTEEMRDERGSRIGFDVVKVNDPDRRLPLARLKSLTGTQMNSGNQVGNYRVLLDNFEEIALPTLDSSADVLLIDEIGKMELFSESFETKVTRVLFSSAERTFVLGTIPQKVPQQHTALFEKIHADKGIKIVVVSQGNRNDLPAEIINYLL